MDMIPNYSRALIVGAGRGLSASLARLLAREGMQIALAARNIDKLGELKAETNGLVVPCDVADPTQVMALFQALDSAFGTPDVVIFNPGRRTRGPLTELDAEAVAQTLQVSAYGGFLVAQEAA